jgi:hypothetical protein
MDNNHTPEQRMRLIIMSIGAIKALLGAAITLIYFGLLPVDNLYLDIPNWVIRILGITWFLSGVGVVVFAGMHINK